MFEKLMYNPVFKHLNEKNLLYKKQFGFQKTPSTEHDIIQLVDQINSNFEKNLFTLGVFIDLSKAFDSANFQIRKIWGSRK